MAEQGHITETLNDKSSLYFVYISNQTELHRPVPTTSKYFACFLRKIKYLNSNMDTYQWLNKDNIKSYGFVHTRGGGGGVSGHIEAFPKIYEVHTNVFRLNKVIQESIVYAAREGKTEREKV